MLASPDDDRVRSSRSSLSISYLAHHAHTHTHTKKHTHTHTVTGYEEREDLDAGFYTVYIVTVSSTATGHEWKLYKRYNEFFNLYNSIAVEYNLENYPAFEDYRFPNKSLFNTFSDFTKIRRRDGFHDLLSRIQQSNFSSMPTAMIEFLDLANNHSRDWSRMREKSGGSGKLKKISPYEFIISKEDYAIVDQHMEVELPWIVYKICIIVICMKLGLMYFGIRLVGLRLDVQVLLVVALILVCSFITYYFRRRDIELELLMAKDGNYIHRDKNANDEHKHEHVHEGGGGGDSSSNNGEDNAEDHGNE